MQYENIIPTHHRHMNMYLGQLFYFNYEHEKSQLKGQQMLLPRTGYKKLQLSENIPEMQLEL
jgi:hypothetical protein